MMLYHCVTSLVLRVTGPVNPGRVRGRGLGAQVMTRGRGPHDRDRDNNRCDAKHGRDWRTRTPLRQGRP
jgi:hypothetical protein